MRSKTASVSISSFLYFSLMSFLNSLPIRIAAGYSVSFVLIMTESVSP